MTDSERLWTAIVLSLFLHFALTLFHAPEQEEPAVFTAVLEMDSSSTLSQNSLNDGTGLQSATPQDREEAEKLDRKRRAYLTYLEEVDNAIHSRRLDGGGTHLIGVALCAFTIAPDGSFHSIALVKTSGSSELDSSALRAVRAASGVVRRPDIIGPDPIQVSLQIKYQYSL